MAQLNQAFPEIGAFNPHGDYYTGFHRSVFEAFMMEYMFVVLHNTGVDAMFHGYLEHENPPYKHFIPLTDEQGRLLTQPSRSGAHSPVFATLLYPAAGNSALAWEFTRHLLNATVNPVGAGKFYLWS